jgi:hypothetical protein
MKLKMNLFILAVGGAILIGVGDGGVHGFLTMVIGVTIHITQHILDIGNNAQVVVGVHPIKVV